MIILTQRENDIVLMRLDLRAWGVSDRGNIRKLFLLYVRYAPSSGSRTPDEHFGYAGGAFGGVCLLQLILRLLCLLFLAAGMALAAGGLWLLLLGGSSYYLMAGLAYCLAAILLLRGGSSGAAISVMVALLSLPFALLEVGLEFWGAFARLLSPAIIAAIACSFLCVLHRSQTQKVGYPRPCGINHRRHCSFRPGLCAAWHGSS